MIQALLRILKIILIITFASHRRHGGGDSLGAGYGKDQIGDRHD